MIIKRPIRSPFAGRSKRVEFSVTTSKPNNLKKTREVNVFETHDEAKAHEIKASASKSHYERMCDFIEIQRRVWGTDNPDVRDNPCVTVRRRDS